MKSELHTLLKKLGAPRPGKSEITQLHALEAEWRHWEAREQKIMPLRIAEEQKAAYAAFLNNPTEANEKALMILADQNLTGIRHALLRRAFSDLRGRITGQAGDLLAPYFAQISTALDAELEKRRGKATTVYQSSDPAVKECQRIIDTLTTPSTHVLHATGRKSEKSPLELAEAILSSAATEVAK